ncbi:MAG: hypothetical protein LBH01_08630 [Verrucomicrobiales bacterium]|jgi:hypothetical protein|nr:hypothetical protein [Verrucomicrobiales bacterium]
MEFLQGVTISNLFFIGFIAGTGVPALVLSVQHKEKTMEYQTYLDNYQHPFLIKLLGFGIHSSFSKALPYQAGCRTEGLWSINSAGKSKISLPDIIASYSILIIPILMFSKLFKPNTLVIVIA